MKLGPTLTNLKASLWAKSHIRIRVKSLHMHMAITYGQPCALRIHAFVAHPNRDPH